MRTYTPHQADATAAQAVLNAYDRGTFTILLEELDGLQQVVSAVHVGGTVTQHAICRAHDAIDRYRSQP